MTQLCPSQLCILWALRKLSRVEAGGSLIAHQATLAEHCPFHLCILAAPSFGVVWECLSLCNVMGCRGREGSCMVAMKRVTPTPQGNIAWARGPFSLQTHLRLQHRHNGRRPVSLSELQGAFPEPDLHILRKDFISCVLHCVSEAAAIGGCLNTMSRASDLRRAVAGTYTVAAGLAEPHVY